MCIIYQKIKKECKNKKKAGDFRYTYQNELDKVFIYYDNYLLLFIYSYVNFQDLARQAASDKVLEKKYLKW